jgi:hypothetical protein
VPYGQSQTSLFYLSHFLLVILVFRGAMLLTAFLRILQDHCSTDGGKNYIKKREKAIKIL